MIGRASCRERVYGDAAESVARQWLDLRMRLVPYLHAVARDAASTGLPVMRAMALAFPDDRAARGFEEQFCCGPALLVAPILRPGGIAELWLPAGGWYDLWTGERNEGGRLLRLSGLPLDRMPVFGREGHLLPLGPAVQHTGEIDAARPVEEVVVFGLPTEPPLPELGLSLAQGHLSAAPRVRAMGCAAEADGAGWRFRPG